MNTLQEVVETLLDIAATDREACAELASMGLVAIDEHQLTYSRLEECVTFLTELKDRLEIE